jgi:hypothetical protein
VSGESGRLNWQRGSLSAKISVHYRARGVCCNFLHRCDCNTKYGVTIGQHGAHWRDLRGMGYAMKQRFEVERQNCPCALVIHHRTVLVAYTQMQALHKVS